MKTEPLYRMNWARILTLCLFLTGIGGIAHATTYDVGSSVGYLAKLSDVPWGSLKPGDTVNIHYTPNGYHEIVQISESGTAAQPIVIKGIPDPNTGLLPVIDGTGAVMDPKVDFRNSVFETFGTILVTPRAKGYVYGQTFPSYIRIESLDIRNALYKANSSITFTDQHGATRLYDAFACGIYIEFARHLTIRGCEISFNGNGIFANSKNQGSQSSADLLIEQNYLHDNGQPYIPNLSNGYAMHNIYVEADGAVYQYNKFGPLRPGCHGVMIKDRSAGTVIRYNEVINTECSNIFAIMDPQGGSQYLEYKPYYPDAYVYGNVITLQPSAFNLSSVVWFGAYNGATYYPTEHRGTLYYYHNTVVSHQSNVTAFQLTDIPYAPNVNIYEKVDCRNNIFYTDTAINSSVWHSLKMIGTSAKGTLDMSANWLSPGTGQLWQGGGSTVNGWNTQLFGDANGLNNPAFFDLPNGDYHLIVGANSVDAAVPIAPSAIALGYDVTEQYLAPQNHVARTPIGIASDLGAFEGAIVVPVTNTMIAVPAVTGNTGSTVTVYGVLTTINNVPVVGRLLTFSVNGVVLGTAVTNANGQCMLSGVQTSNLGIGAIPLTVSFAGDAFYNASIGSGTLTISKSATKLTIESPSGKVGVSGTLKATLTRKSDGALLSGKLVRFQLDGVDIGTTTTVSGVALLPFTITNSLTIGTHTLTALFDGDSLNLNTASTGGTLTVLP